MYPISTSSYQHIRMAPKRKLKPIWDAPAEPADPTMRSLTNAFAKMDIETMAPPPVKRLALTLGEEVQENIEEWCASQGIPVPPEYIGYGERLDKEHRDQVDAEFKRMDDEEKNEADKPAGEKPPFGTPEFWAWARKRKIEKEKEAAAAAIAAGGSAPAPAKKAPAKARGKK
jgi:hypothetical protein